MVVARGWQIETESAPVRYVAELLGADTDSERAIRWLILMMVLCCDPLAIALTAAASADGVSQQWICGGLRLVISLNHDLVYSTPVEDNPTRGRAHTHVRREIP
jgi:hypothetical protein